MISEFIPIKKIYTEVHIINLDFFLINTDRFYLVWSIK